MSHLIQFLSLSLVSTSWWEEIEKQRERTRFNLEKLRYLITNNKEGEKNGNSRP